MSQTRIARLRAELRKKQLDAFVVTAPSHIRYLTNFTGSNGACIVRPRSVSLFTDSRYALQVKGEVKGRVSCKIIQGDLFEAIAELFVPGRSVRLGFEADDLSYGQFKNLTGKRSGVVRPIPTKGVMEELVAPKEPAEVRFIRRAVKISSAVFETILSLLRPGIREIDIAAEISYLQKLQGGEGDAFDPIVASGPRSALPHARPTKKKIRNGDLLLMDFGCSVNGYHSDITRTVVIGRASQKIRRLYTAVLEAKNRAIESVKPGVRASVIDGVARRHLISCGLGRQFTHSLGHGLGLSVHERPRLSPLSRDTLSAGNVITIEPGVYLPSVGGVRLEDDVLVTSHGHQMISKADDELRVV